MTGTRCSTHTTLSSARNSLALQGREVNTSGDGFLAMFDGPQRAIRCAMSIRDVVQALGIEVRAGLHTGECEVRGDDIGARVSALAGPNDVLVSSTLRDLVIGSGLELEDRGAYERSRRTRPVAPLRSRLSVSLPSKRRLVVGPWGSRSGWEIGVVASISGILAQFPIASSFGVDGVWRSLVLGCSCGAASSGRGSVGRWADWPVRARLRWSGTEWETAVGCPDVWRRSARWAQSTGRCRRVAESRSSRPDRDCPINGGSDLGIVRFQSG